MAVEVGLWNIQDNKPRKVELSGINLETRLEDILENDISLLGEDFLIIGRQVLTAYGKSIDLLSINGEGNLTVIELKRDKTPRDAVAQALDYASWVNDLSYDEIKTICENHHVDKDIEQIFEEKYGYGMPEKINEEHDMLIVCSGLDNESERIVNYLSDYYDVPINVAFFRYFQDGDNEYITRSWLISPEEVLGKAGVSKHSRKREEWNKKDFVVNIAVNENGESTWEDSVKYGFVSAGGGSWYSNSLKQLYPDSRVFAMIPKRGYLGVGIVKERSVPVKDFNVEIDGDSKPIQEVDLKTKSILDNKNDLEICEYMVRVEWITTLTEQEAYWEKGLRANQNSAFKLKNKFTLEKLIKHFNLTD